MDWTVDYGDGPRPCTVPHAWRQEVDVRWEGPAIYRCNLHVEQEGKALRFWGVSYEARVFIDGELAVEHRGIWDSFDVPLGPAGRTVEVLVEVRKNGGPSFPVKDVLSGFLPYVYHTFGGIFREVELVSLSLTQELVDPPEGPEFPAPRISVDGTKLFIDGKPWYMRGVLSWGWYPDVGSPHPPIGVVREEVRKIKALGFNLVKFCLWLPPHYYFQVLEEEDMWAWIELPLWMPSEKMDLDAALGECERIVRQYRDHDRIVCWTCGCELSTSTPHEFRKSLFEMVRDLTGCPLVKDNSGGSEMYGGDLREYGTFYDYHPYCDTQFYPVVLDSLMVGPRKKMPILLGEFNDYDVYRPLGQWLENPPYWASIDPESNDQGVRWQHDLPGVIAGGLHPSNEQELRERSIWDGAWIRQYVLSNVATHDDIAGYVITGIADTPISTSGVLGLQQSEPWKFGFNPTECEFSLVPFRRPPWVHGGNRPGWSDIVSYFVGEVALQVSVRSFRRMTGTLYVSSTSTSNLASAHVILEAPHFRDTVQMPIVFEGLGYHELQLELECDDGSQHQEWFEILVSERLDEETTLGWTGSLGDGSKWPAGFKGQIVAPPDLPPGANWMSKASGETIYFLKDSGTLGKPFWRECVREESVIEPLLSSRVLLFGVSTDRVIDSSWLDSTLPSAEWLLVRTDTRTFERHPYVVRKGKLIVTTLRPWGGLGSQPYGLDNNPAGNELMRILMMLATGA